VDAGLVRHEPGEDAPEAQRFVAELEAHPVLAARGGIALVEDEVDDLEHRGQPGRELCAARNLERDAPLGERALRPHDALGDRRLRHQERPCDLLGREPAEETKREGGPRLRRKHRVARAKRLVRDILGERQVIDDTKKTADEARGLETGPLPRGTPSRAR
jgi:hypothetical protein